ncbi:YeiH family protein [Bacillus atrophaeus]|uniref:YeiH family protein n=1 Tax=Bacillus atrophaeus TaxID=1452 RepID=UPI002E20A44A|nr:YeiH family protein [Bacillus atrophaeus]MED1032149.1 YeiH family protein [Bacillus atrophaeus]MED1119288.1 YeiH family protein [Bacillus atrophaeus]MED1130475.1 YeiH family protein [Bacillus atrophaeus]
MRTSFSLIHGLALTAALALSSVWAVRLPFLSMLGPLVIAMMLGIMFRSIFGTKKTLQPGISFSSKHVLRLGIILLGMRLNLTDIYHAGANVFFVAVFSMAFSLAAVYILSRWFRVDQKLSILTACGTAICGAAAVVAIAPQIKANDNETAISAAAVSILGTLFTVIYTVIYSIIGLAPGAFGAFAGGTLHEVAHVVAAAAAGGSDAVDMAIIVKLTRVALLVPVALILGMMTQRKKGAGKLSFTSLPIPWFILGFLAMSAFHTSGMIPEAQAEQIVSVSYFLIGMAMAGLGLKVHVSEFQENGGRALAAGLIGSVLLSLFGYAIVFLLI